MFRVAIHSIGMLAATPASAAIVQVRYDGIVAKGSALPGLFGGAADLTGLAYTTALIYDTSLGNLVEGPDFAFRQGGTFFGAVNPFISGNITINGVTVDLIGGTYSQIGSRSGASFSQTYHDSNFRGMMGGYEVESFIVQFINIYSTRIPLDIDGHLDFAATSDDQGVGYFSITVQDSASREYLRVGSGNLTPNRVRIGLLASAVPEASTWTLMIAGFGILGCALRPRTSRVARAA